MTRHLSRALRFPLLGAVLLLATSCSSLIPPPTADTTRYYVFTAVPCDADKPLNKEIGLRAIELPGYLKATKALVVRRGENELVYVDAHRWAEPLDAGLVHAIKDRLCAKLGPGTVLTTPYPSDIHRDFEVSIRISQCEGDLTSGAAVRFSAVFVITKGDGSGQVVTSKQFKADNLEWDGKEYSSLVKALSLGVAQLADAVAAGLSPTAP